MFKVEKLLQAGPDGLYLVKNSTEFPGDTTLCVSYEGSVHYFRVRHLTTEHRSRTILQDSALAPQQNPAISSTLVACSSKFPTDPCGTKKKICSDQRVLRNNYQPSVAESYRMFLAIGSQLTGTTSSTPWRTWWSSTRLTRATCRANCSWQQLENNLLQLMIRK